MTNKQTVIIAGVTILSMIAIVCMDVFIITPNLMKNNSFIEARVNPDYTGFPMLMEYAYSDSGECAVLFQSPNKGTVIWVKYEQEHGRYVGEYRTDWSMGSFKKSGKKYLINNR